MSQRDGIFNVLKENEGQRGILHAACLCMCAHICIHVYVFIHVYTHVLKDKSKIKMCSDYPPYSPFK